MNSARHCERSAAIQMAQEKPTWVGSPRPATRHAALATEGFAPRDDALGLDFPICGAFVLISIPTPV